MWILLRFAESLYLPGSPLGPGSADQYLHAYLTSLVLLPSELERALSVSTPFNIQVACEESSFTVAVVSGTTAGQLVEAERRLLGRGFSIKLFADEHVVPEHALLQPRAYRIVRRPKVSARPVDSQLLCVNAWVTDHWDTVSVPAGTFVFQVARQLGLQGTTRIVENPGSMQVPLDSRIWQSVDLCFAACGDEDSAHNEGIDAAMLSAMARATPEICLAVESGLHYLEPEFLSALLLQEPQTVQETIAKVVPDDAGTVAGFVACDNHWALLVYERTRWPPAIYYDGIPDRLVVQARWLLEQLHVRLGAGAFAMQQASIVKQSGGTHCGGIALANLRWHLHSELSLTEAQVLAMYPCQGGSGPFVACGAADFASAQQWLQEFLPARGVPEAKASERAALALKRLGVNAILRCRQLPNPWRGLKELANTKQFQWVTYEELQEHIKVQSTMERGASSADRPRKQRKDGQATKADIKVALTPERLVLPKGAFVDQARSPVGQLTLNEVSSTARGVVIVSLEQALPFIKDGKPISVDALALLTVEPVPHELQGLLPVASLRWPAIYVGTNEPILICGSLVQLGDDVVAKAVSECTAPKSVATCLLRFQVYKDQFGDSWEAFVRGPVKMLCQRHACLQKCSAQNCGVACTKFHAPVDEEVDSVVLDAFGWRWFSQAGKVEPPGKASSFSVLIRVPVSASKAVVDLSGTDGLYVEPRSDLGKGPHPDYSVIWLPGDSHDAALHRKRTLDKVQHVTRLNGKYGLRVKVSDEAAVRAELFPGQHFVACKASEVFQAGPFPHGMTKQALQQFLQAASWTARPLRPVRSTLEGRFWEIGSESSPPSPILSLGQQDVTVSHVRSRQHPPPDASNLFASDKTLRHLQQVNADPWDSMDPWKAFAEQRKGHAAAEDVASSADSKLASLEQRLQASLEETVKARVHELQQDVDMSTAQTETGQHQEVLKLRTDLEELKAQNQKFEGWFKNAGDQVSCLQQQVGSLASQVQEQGVSNAALTQMVNSMQQSWRSELQSAMDSQTDRLEAARIWTCSRNLMGTLRCFFLLLAFLFRIGEASHPGPPLIIGTANPSGINGRQESFAALPNGIWSVSETHATESVYRSFKQALGSAADRSRKLRTVHGAFASLRARSQTTGAWTGVMNVSAYPCRQLNVQWRGLEYTSGRALVSQFLVGDHHITGATIYGVPPSSAYNQPLQTTAQILQTITQEVVYGHSGMRFVAGDMNCGPHDLSIFRCWERLGWVEAQLEGFRRWGRALEPTSKGKSVKDQVWLSPELAKYLVSVSNEDDHFPDHSVLYAQLELPGGSAAMANTNTWPLPSPFPWGNFDLQRWTPCSVGTEWDVASSEQAFASWSRQVASLSGGLVAAFSTRDPRPSFLPCIAPSAVVAQLVFDDFHANYKHYEQWSVRRRRDLLQAKVAKSSKALFAAVAAEQSSALDSLLLTTKTEIADVCGALVTLDRPVPERPYDSVLADGQFVTVQPCSANTVTLTSPHELAIGQTLTFQHHLASFEDIQQELLALWRSKWQKHESVPPDRWTRILRFAEVYLPPIPMRYTPITLDDWKGALRRHNQGTSVGPDGWSIQDLTHLPDQLHLDLLRLFQAVESGGSWPCQMTVGFVCTIAKICDACAPTHYRPIVIVSVLYRVWASIRGRQILGCLSEHVPSQLHGYMAGKQACDVWYLLQAEIEATVSLRGTMAGHTADIIKCFNCLAHTPIFGLAARVGIPSQICHAWKEAVSSLQRRFRIRSEVGVATTGTTGFAEGDPLSCVAITLFDMSFHAYQAAYTPQCRSVSYVDNIELLASTGPQLHHGVLVLQTYMDLWDLDLDPGKSFSWALDSSTRKELRSLGHRVSYSSKDLGGQMSYGALTRIDALTDRFRSLSCLWNRLKVLPAPTRRKLHIIKMSAWPKALYGCENVAFAQTHIDQLRTKAMEAMRWNRPGASPLVRFSLLCDPIHDPGFYQVWSVLRAFRRHVMLDITVPRWWIIFRASWNGCSGQGPMRKLRQVFDLLGWDLDSSGRLVFETFSCQFDSLPLQALKCLARHAWMLYVCNCLRARQDFRDLVSFDECTRVPSRIDPADHALLGTVQDGTAFTNAFKAKFDKAVSAQCGVCNARDSLEHRCCHCPKYESVRSRFRECVRDWGHEPVSFSHHAMVPAFPAQLEYWQALQDIPNMLETFEFLPEPGLLYHVFTDGSCQHPSEPWRSLATWACVHWDSGRVLAAGLLPGMLQSTARAELFAVLSVLHWSQRAPCEICIWADSLDTVNGMLFLQTGAEVPSHWANEDLWRQARQELLQVRCKVHFQHTPSHCDLDSAETPMQEWLIQGNQAADSAAGAMQRYWPEHIQKLSRQLVRHKSAQTQRVNRQAAFLVAIAKESKTAGEPPVIDEEVPLSELVQGLGTCELLLASQFPEDLELALLTPRLSKYPAALVQDLAHWLCGAEYF
ncbi:Retrovirus-related Pol polyprotein from type-1 retrotransposable element R2 [Symbiodinium microadriaticum]|uniref:Retrovirus-related Pol polyprotein from type-1 retrotransposable element R2 n=1 Tax=Symbiodinium microadriaticum TaxID=2951 RepID=A0A1Q9DUT8_SYMMI|nr:Retrovirus-related Pol polyprotein from type-1 retrotransposable element R2 [Symbiodinium microadriaticum]